MTLTDLFENEYRSIRHLSQKAISCYQVSLRHIDRHMALQPGREPGPARLNDLSDLALSRFVAERERNTCRATAKRDRTQILCLWRYACRCGYLTRWPNPTPLRVPVRVPRATRADELERLLAYFAGINGTIDGVPAGVWWGSLITALFQCGTRIGETLAVEWPYVNVAERTILFKAETRKGQTRDIVRDITDELAANLSSRARQSGRVWKWDRSATHLWAHFRDHCKRAEVPYLGFHAIRKAACSYTKAAGGDATKLADHADVATTEVYIDPTIAPPESNLARLPLLRQLRRESLEPAEPPSREEDAMRAGHTVGRVIGRVGLPRPSREEADDLAQEHGHSGPMAQWFRDGLTSGWWAATRHREAAAG